MSGPGHVRPPEADRGPRHEGRANASKVGPSPIVRRRLAVGRVDDPLEDEADAMADLVLRMIEGGGAQAAGGAPSRPQETRIRRSSADEEPGPEGARTAPSIAVASAGGEGEFAIVAQGEVGTVGSASLHTRDDSSVEVTDLKVSPEERQRGYGRDLLASAAQQGEHLGKSKIALASQDTGTGRLDNWYRTMGFDEVGTNEYGYSEFEAPTDRLVRRQVQREVIATASGRIQRMERPPEKAKVPDEKELKRRYLAATNDNFTGWDAVKKTAKGPGDLLKAVEQAEGLLPQAPVVGGIPFGDKPIKKEGKNTPKMTDTDAKDLADHYGWTVADEAEWVCSDKKHTPKGKVFTDGKGNYWGADNAGHVGFAFKYWTGKPGKLTFMGEVHHHEPFVVIKR